MTKNDYTTAAYQGTPNFATWAIILWVDGGMRESEAMYRHLLPLIRVGDVETFKAEFLEVLTAWQSGMDLKTHPMALSWLNHEVVRGVVTDWMNQFVATLNWSQIATSPQEKCSISNSPDPLQQAASHFVKEVIAAHFDIVNWEAVLNQLVQKMGATQE